MRRAQNYRPNVVANVDIPLAGVVSVQAANQMGDADFRHYIANVTTQVNMLRLPDSSTKTIVYNVGRRGDPVPLMENDMDVNWRISQVIRLLPVMAESLTTIARKYTNFTGIFEHCDLAGGIYQLSKGLAAYSVTHVLTCDMLRGGNPLSLRSLNIRDAPIAASESSVFIPRNAALDVCAGTFVALVAAFNGMGASVYTDVVTVDGNNAPVIVEPTNGVLAQACSHGLRILLSMYDRAGEGAVAALAVAKGIHEIVSVAGHSDEGGYMRDVMRLGGYVVPFGGIYLDGNEGYMGLPSITRGMTSTVQALVDGIALTTAGLFALSDPLVVVDGEYYPTVFQSDIAQIAVAGTAQNGGANDSAALTTLVAMHAPRMVEIYLPLLCKLFCVTGGEAQAATMMTGMFNLSAGQDYAHMRYKNIHPYFWVEPTTLFRVKWDCPANNSGYGILGEVNGHSTMPLFESIMVVEDNSYVAKIAIKMRTGRTCGLLLHLQQHPLAGLASLIPSQFLEDKMSMKGGAQTAAAARTAGAGFDEYLWGRGHSSLLAPAELMYNPGTIGVTVVKGGYNAQYQYTANHVPLAEELSGHITISASRPSYVGCGALNNLVKTIRRGRTAALTALTNAREMMGRYMATGGEIWGVGNFEPVIRRNLPAEVIPAAVYDQQRVEFEVREPVVQHAGAVVPVIMHMREARAPNRAPPRQPAQVQDAPPAPGEGDVGFADFENFGNLEDVEFGDLMGAAGVEAPQPPDA